MAVRRWQVCVPSHNPADAITLVVLVLNVRDHRVKPQPRRESLERLNHLVQRRGGIDFRRRSCAQQRLDRLNQAQGFGEFGRHLPYGLFDRVVNRSISTVTGALSSTMWSNCG
jgi:hypothetical protein